MMGEEEESLGGELGISSCGLTQGETGGDHFSATEPVALRNANYAGKGPRGHLVTQNIETSTVLVIWGPKPTNYIERKRFVLSRKKRIGE